MFVLLCFMLNKRARALSNILTILHIFCQNIFILEEVRFKHLPLTADCY